MEFFDGWGRLRIQIYCSGERVMLPFLFPCLISFLTLFRVDGDIFVHCEVEEVGETGTVIQSQRVEGGENSSAYSIDTQQANKGYFND